MDFDAMRYRYPSRRTVVFGSRGMVATGQPLAAQAGLDILKKGGNAVDAAVAAAACLTVVEPTSNGIGGDCFALVWSGGWLRASDLAAYRPEWVEPLSANYRGYDVWEIPPNGHGIAALMALNLLKGFGLPDERETAEVYHLQIESMKVAYADVLAYVVDPRFMSCTAQDLLSEAYADERRKRIGAAALDPAPGRPPRGGTVYLAAADGEGNMVSMIQSNYMGFGSGLVVPGTGIALHNRGCNFSLDPGSPNCLAPGKKPYHTIIPGFLTKDGAPVGPFGVMGAFMQPQGHLQVVSNLVDFGMNPQEALDTPRWQWIEGRTVQMERGVSADIALFLESRGHDVRVIDDPAPFGRGEIVARTSFGTLAGGTEPRTDGCVAAW